MADYRSPAMCDQLGYTLDCHLRIFCVCKRDVSISLVSLKQEFRLFDSMTIYEIADRLRCKECRQRPRLTEVLAGRPRRWRD